MRNPQALWLSLLSLAFIAFAALALPSAFPLTEVPSVLPIQVPLLVVVLTALVWATSPSPWQSTWPPC